MNHRVVLPHRQTIDLVPRAPFDFDATVHKPDHFPSADNAWVPGVRWQTMRWQGCALGLVLENCGTRSHPGIRLSAWSENELGRMFLDDLALEVTQRLNLSLDLAEFNRRFRDDAQLGPIIRRWRGLRPACYSSLYEYLIIAIVLQNCTVRRSVAMMQTLFERYGTPVAYDGREMFCFWEPEQLASVSEQELRDLKIGYRAKSIKRVTEAFVRREIDELELRRLSVEEQREALLSLYGIGPASVGYLLFDVFHRWDELSHISPWELKIYTKLFLDRDPEKPVAEAKMLRLFARRFGGYRMLAVHHIWEDLFWRRKQGNVDWLNRLIRL